MGALIQKGGEIDAKCIVGAIEEQEDIYLRDTYIKGSLDLSKPDELKQSPESEEPFLEGKPTIRIIKSEISFISCVFDGTINLAHCKFYKDVVFSSSAFKERVHFYPGTEFHKTAEFYNAKFCKSADFSFVKFKDDVTFQEASFKQNGNTIIEFSGAKFEGEANFKFMRFIYTEHDDTKLEARFDRTIFQKKASFSNSVFKIILFWDAIFYENVSFYRCVFVENADFQSATFNKTADFSLSQFNKNILLNGASFNRLLVRWNEIENKLGDIEWWYEEGKNKAIKEHRDRIISEYETTYIALIRNFKQLGQFYDADRCQLDYRNKSRIKLKNIKTLNHVAIWMFDRISWHFYGYGLNCLRPIYTSGFLIISYTLIYIALYYFDEFGFQLVFLCDSQALSLISKSFYSCLIAFFSNPNVNGATSNLVNWVGISERILGIILISTFLVTLAKKTIRF